MRKHADNEQRRVFFFMNVGKGIFVYLAYQKLVSTEKRVLVQKI